MQAPIHLKTLCAPLAGCAVALLLCAQPGMLMGIGLVLPIMLVAWLTLIVVAVRKPEQRLRCAVKALLYVVTLGLIWALHQTYPPRAKAHAQAVSTAIEHYRQAQGHYPSNLSSLNIPNANDWHLRYTRREDGKPLLHYPSTAIPFDTYVYDFSTHQWEFQPD